LHTERDLQMTVMSLKVGEFIPLEEHNVSQFIRIEKGNAMLEANGQEKMIKKDEVTIIKPNTYHTIRNVGKGELKLYSIYAGKLHPIDEILVEKPK